MTPRKLRLALGLAALGLVACAAGLVIAQPSLPPQMAAQPMPSAQPQMPPMPQSSGPMMIPASASSPVQVSQPMLPATEPRTLPRQIAPPPMISNGSAETIHPADVATEQTDSASGRMEPGVSIEWIGPATAKVGQAVSYQIIVKNICANPVQQVAIKVHIHQGAAVNATEPKARIEGENLVWDIGALEPRQEKRLDMQLTPNATGTIACQAMATITSTATAHLQVHEPKLAIKAAAPEQVIVGDPATIGLTVTNPGDAVAERVKVVANLTEGLEHARGSSIEFDLGNLAPKETRTVYVLCSAKTPGAQKCEATVTGDPRLIAADAATVEVMIPKIELTVSGPGMRYLDRHAIYTFRVTNPGTATANNVRLMDEVPQGFTFAAASGDGRHDFVSRTVSWYLGELPPGQSQEVTLDLVAVNAGELKNKATVSGGRGIKGDADITTHVEGVGALLMELVDLDDPLEVGADTAYEIRITNTGTKTETNLELCCTVPDKMECRGAKAPPGINFKQDGKEIVFDTVPKLAPRADVIYRVNVRGIEPGDVRFRARMKADGLTEPVLKEESTRIYGDERPSK